MTVDETLERIAIALERIADALEPEPEPEFETAYKDRGLLWV